MTGFITSLLAFIVVLSILITVHEYGHFWVARRCGVKVLRFSVGFGNALWKRVAGADKTEYVIAAIPLGGYVKMLDEREGPVESHELARAFNRQSVSKRMAIVAAGPFFNFAFAIVAYWLMFVIGTPGLKPLVDAVDDSSIAARAGVHAGDEIVAVNGRATPTWQSVRQEVIPSALDRADARIALRGRDGVTDEVTLSFATLEVDPQDARFIEKLGIHPIQLNLPPVIGAVLDGQVADQAGLKPGDRVISTDGTAVNDWAAWVELVRARPDQVIRVVIERDGARLEIELKPSAAEEGGVTIGRIGAAPMEKIPEVPEEWRATLQYGPFAAVGEAVARTWEMSVLTLQMLWKMLVGQVSLDNLSGPITIAKYAGTTANIGITAFLSFLAIVSVSLGVLNLLPIPMLDGGHLFYYVVEVVRRKPLSDDMQLRLQRIGLFILLMLMSLALYNDVARLIR